MADMNIMRLVAAVAAVVVELVVRQCVPLGVAALEAEAVAVAEVVRWWLS